MAMREVLPPRVICYWKPWSTAIYIRQPFGDEWVYSHELQPGSQWVYSHALRSGRYVNLVFELNKGLLVARASQSLW